VRRDHDQTRDLESVGMSSDSLRKLPCIGRALWRMRNGDDRNRGGCVHEALSFYLAHEPLREQRAAQVIGDHKSFVINTLVGSRFRAQTQSDWMSIILSGRAGYRAKERSFL
jgi:hypothetical protein